METELVSYIKNAKNHGLSEAEIKQNLVNAGWDAGSIEESFAHAKSLEHQTQGNLTDHYRQGMQKNISPLTHQTHNQAPELKKGESIQDFSNEVITKKGFTKTKIALIVILALLVLSGSAAGAYFFILKSPTKVWEGFKKVTRSQIYNSNFKIGYTDENEELKPDFAKRLNIKSLKFNFDGKLYSDESDTKNPIGSADMQYTFGSGNSSFSTGIKVILLNKIAYMNIGENPFLANMFGDEQIDWLKIDLNSIEESSNQSINTEELNKYKEIFNPSFNEELTKIWEEATFVKMDKYLGREKVDNITTLHFKNTLDKQAIKDAFINTVNKVQEAYKTAGEDLDPKDFEYVTMIVNALVDKLEIKEFETWIGQNDFRLYKVKFVSNAPSLISLINLGSESLNVARESSRDAKRLADVRMFASAFELYYNDNNQYPESKDGKPVGLTPAYLGVLPEAPTPADGKCTDYFNPYWYERKTKDKYEMTFCLGNEVGGYSGGLSVLSPSGISTNIACTFNREECEKMINKIESPESDEDIKTQEMEEIQKFIDNLSYTAEFRMEETYTNYGQKQELQAPDGAKDIMELIQKQNSEYLYTQ